MPIKTISIVTPTFNSMRTIKLYMDAIVLQNYPHESIEVVFSDGGSTDGTLEELENFKKSSKIKITILQNLLRTAEAGKSIGVKNASNDIICLLDSDNILPSDDWLDLMMEPFNDSEIVASEPIEYTYRTEDNVINRYCALIGMNDPLCLFTGNYDRFCTISNKWTQMKREEIDKGNYLSVLFQAEYLPTIGANGFFIRKDVLLSKLTGDYLFDIDILYEILACNPNQKIAKVKTGIIHLFCKDIETFYRKQKRRIMDYTYFSKSNLRKYPWKSVGRFKIIMFVVSTVTILPIFIQSVIGYRQKRDIEVWGFHIIACWITLITYSIGLIAGKFNSKLMNRDKWKQ